MTMTPKINQNPPHQLSADTQKVRPILPLYFPDIHQLQVCFVDERRSLQCVVGTLRRHVPARHGVQLPVNDGKQLFERKFVALTPSQQESCHFCGCWCSHSE